MKSRIKDKISSEIAQLRKEIPLPEYIFWWVARIWLLAVTCIDYKDHIGDGHYNLQMTGNFLLMFILPELHILPRHKKVLGFFARLSYRAQTVAVAMIFVTCVCGLHYNFYGVYWADTFIHFVGGIVVVPVGIYILTALGEKNMSPTIKSAVGFGISCFAALFWEFYEFTFDNIRAVVTDDVANTQAWADSPSPFISALLPRLVNDEALHQRWGLLDTMTDLSLGLAGALVGAIAVRIICEYEVKKENKKRI